MQLRLTTRQTSARYKQSTILASHVKSACYETSECLTVLGKGTVLLLLLSASLAARLPKSGFFSSASASASEPVSSVPVSSLSQSPAPRHAPQESTQAAQEHQPHACCR